MIQGNMTIIAGGEEGSEDCSLCSKAKEGVAVEVDRAEHYLCWPCLKKLVRMKMNAKPKEEAPRPLLDHVEAANGR